MVRGGDFVKNEFGYPAVVSGRQELMQRVMVRLCVRRGCFAPDPDLGSRLYTLVQGNPRAASRDALSYAREALDGMENAEVLSACAVFDGDGNAEVTVRIRMDGGISEVRVGVES